MEEQWLQVLITCRKFRTSKQKKSKFENAEVKQRKRLRESVHSQQKMKDQYAQVVMNFED